MEHWVIRLIKYIYLLTIIHTITFGALNTSERLAFNSLLTCDSKAASTYQDEGSLLNALSSVPVSVKPYYFNTSEPELFTTVDVTGQEQNTQDLDIPVDEISKTVLKSNSIPDSTSIEPIEIGIPVELPFIGTIQLIPFTQDTVSGYKVKIPHEGTLKWGPLIVEPAFLTLINNHLSFSTRAHFFGTPVSLVLQSTEEEPTTSAHNKNTSKKYKKLSFVIQSDAQKPITLELIPGKKIILQTAELIIVKNQPTTIKASTTLFDQPATITFVTSKEKTSVSCSINDVAFNQITPAVKNSPLHDAHLTQVTITVDNFSQTGVGLSATLQGKTSITYPTIGTLATNITASLHDKHIDFSGAIEKPVNTGNITIEDAHVSFSSKDATLSLSGSSTILGYKTRVTFSRNKDGEINAHATVLDKEIFPFKPFNIPGVSDIAIKNPMIQLKYGSKGYTSIVQGSAQLFGLELQSELIFKATTGQTGTVVLKAKAPNNWKLSQGFPQLKNTLFDNIILTNLEFIISSDQYTDTEKNLTYKKGFNIVAQTTLSGSLAPVADFTQSPQTSTITIAGHISSNFIDSSFKAQIPGGIVIKQDNIQIGKLELEISGTPPKFALLTSIRIKPSPADDWLNLTARIHFAPPEDVAMAATMQGQWHNALGVSGINLEDIALEVGFNILTFPLTGLPSKVGIAGGLKLGGDENSPVAKMALSIPIAGSQDLVMVGKLTKLSLTDLVNFAVNLVGQKLSLPGNMQDFNFKDVDIYVVPKATTIGELDFPQGLTIQGIMNLPGFTADVKLIVSMLGIIAEGTCTEINFGPLLVTASENDTTPEDNPAFKGPRMKFAITLIEQEILLSGLLKVGALFEEDAFLKINKSGIILDFKTSLGKALYHGAPLFETHVKGLSSGSLSDPQFEVEFEFTDNLRNFVVDQINQGIEQAQRKVADDLNKAIEEVEKLKQISAETEIKIDKAKKEVTDARKKLDDIDTAIKESDEKLSEAQSSVSSLQKKIDDLQESIRNEKDWCDNLPWYSKIQCVASGVKITAWEVAVVALKASKAIANTTLEGLKQVSKAPLLLSRKTAELGLSAAEGFLIEVSKPVVSGVLTATRESGKGVLIGTRETTTGLLEATKQVTIALIKTPPQIEKIQYKGNLKDAAQGRLGNTACTINMFGQKLNLYFELDINNPVNSVKNLVEMVIKQASDILKI